jgi:hypothetical protein
LLELGSVPPKKDELARQGLAGNYERAAFIWEAAGDGLMPAVLGAPKIHAPTPASNKKVSSATETTAKL